MRAVNLLPAQPRGRAFGLSVSAPFAGVCGGLALVMAGTALYVTEHNRVTARQTELSHLTAGVARWDATAQSYARFTAEARQHATQLADVRQLVTSRYDWAELLGEIAGQLPQAAQLSSLQASSPTAADATAQATSGESGLQLTGCAASQSTVAQTMVNLRRVTGVTSVTLNSATASGAAGAASSTSSQGCVFPVQFSLSLGLGSAVTPEATAADSANTDTSGGSTAAAS